MAKCIRCGRTISAFTFGRICVWCKQHEAAQRGEDSAYQPVMPTPWARSEASPMVTQAIFGINVAVFVGMLLSGASPLEPSSASLLSWGANYSPYTLSGEWWRLITACFVHIGIIHLALNMWCLWSLGALAERFYGRSTFACIYLLCGIAGSLGSVFWHQPPTVSAGASGAIFGITGALIASLKLGGYSFSGFARGTLQCLIAFVGYNLLFGAAFGQTDNANHIGGLLAGVVLGGLVAKAAPDSRLLPRLGILTLVATLLGAGTYSLQRSRGFHSYMMRATERVAEGDIDRAALLFEKAVKLHPESASGIHYLLARAYGEKHNYEAADRELQKSLAAAPGDQEIAYELGQMRLEQHRLNDAQRSFEQLLAANPQSALAYLGLGDVSMARDDCAAAQREYDKAEQISPRLQSLNLRKGQCWARIKQYDQAIAAYRKEIELNGDDANTERLLADVYKVKGMTSEADTAAKQAEKLARESDDE